VSAPRLLRGPSNPDIFRVSVNGARWYRDNLPADRKWKPMLEAVPAVTTVKKAWSKPFRKRTTTGITVPLDSYRAAEYVIGNLAELTEMHPEHAFGMIATAPERDLGKAADRGTALHTVMESYAVGQAPAVELLEEPVRPFVDACRAFVADWRPVWRMAEVLAFNRQIGFAGTADAVLELDGLGLCLVDWKSRGSGHGAYPEEACQIGGYGSADYFVVQHDSGQLERIEPPAVDAGVVVSITADDGYRVYPIDIGKARRAFLGMFETWRIRRDGEREARQAIGLPRTKPDLHNREREQDDNEPRHDVQLAETPSDKQSGEATQDHGGGRSSTSAVEIPAASTADPYGDDKAPHQRNDDGFPHLPHPHVDNAGDLPAAGGLSAVEPNQPRDDADVKDGVQGYEREGQPSPHDPAVDGKGNGLGDRHSRNVDVHGQVGHAGDDNGRHESTHDRYPDEPSQLGGQQKHQHSATPEIHDAGKKDSGEPDDGSNTTDNRQHTEHDHYDESEIGSLRQRVIRIVETLGTRSLPVPWPAGVPTFRSGSPMSFGDHVAVDQWCWGVESLLGLPFPEEIEAPREGGAQGTDDGEQGGDPDGERMAISTHPADDSHEEWARKGKALLSLLDDEQLARECAAVAQCEATKMTRLHYLALQAVVTQVSDPAGVVVAYWSGKGVEIQPAADMETALIAAMPIEVGEFKTKRTKREATRRARNVAKRLRVPAPRSYEQLCGDLLLACCVAVGHGVND
jgi:hypothetical protein